MVTKYHCFRDCLTFKTKTKTELNFLPFYCNARIKENVSQVKMHFECKLCENISAFWNGILFPPKYCEKKFVVVNEKISANSRASASNFKSASWVYTLWNHFQLFWNGILFPKLFSSTVKKNCCSDREKLLKFKAMVEKLIQFSKVILKLQTECYSTYKDNKSIFCRKMSYSRKPTRKKCFIRFSWKLQCLQNWFQPIVNCHCVLLP